MQAYRAVGIGTGVTVFQIAFDVAANGSKLRPDLVMAACEKLHFEKIITVAGCYFPILQFRLQPPLPRQVMHVGFVLLFVFF